MADHHEFHYEFRLLGPVEVVAGRTIRDLGGRRQRIVLGALLLRLNHTVETEALTDAVWSREPPGTARRQLHNAVATLRRTLPDPGLIRTDPHGYRLAAPPGTVDAQRFQNAVRRGRYLAGAGRPDEAVRAFRDGLALWRGPALAGLQDRLGPAVIGLEETRLAALEDCLEIEVARGPSAAAVAELLELTTRHPLRERFTGALMTGLHRMGRRAEAIDAYRSTSRLLAEELGVDPHPSLQERFCEILRGGAEVSPAG